MTTRRRGGRGASADSRAAPRVRVAFQGELGAFSEDAVRALFGEAAEPVPRREFREVGVAVVAGEVEYGLLPIENTLAGSVVTSYDVLAAEPLRVIGEVIVPIHHCVLGLPGSRLAGVRRVLSHPVALAQCTRFLLEHPEIEALAVYDTAGAAREVAERRDASVAAIAGRRAADRYALEILAHDIEDRPDNQTRFLAVVRQEHLPAPAGADPGAARKTALLVETENVPGALVHVLLPFASRGINLSKLESRPGAEPWTYRFFMELEADAGTAAAREALAEVSRRATSLRVLGSYPKWMPR
ncbi:MAG: prephenate dehydratase [Gemmatimonadetes bacterium]|nr:prephenate dehydratase [Gemmatimonadota bacterium]